MWRLPSLPDDWLSLLEPLSSLLLLLLSESLPALHGGGRMGAWLSDCIEERRKAATTRALQCMLCSPVDSHLPLCFRLFLCRLCFSFLILCFCESNAAAGGGVLLALDKEPACCLHTKICITPCALITPPAPPPHLLLVFAALVLPLLLFLPLLLALLAALVRLILLHACKAMQDHAGSAAEGSKSSL